MTKQIITLHELEQMIAKAKSEFEGKPYKPDYPKELTPAWIPYCNKTWGAFAFQFKHRETQMGVLGILETHEIDFYKNHSLNNHMGL
jgi:hypothetical protein